MVGIHLPEVLQIPERGAKLRSNQEAVEMTYEENPQTLERDFPHTWKAQTPRFPHSHRPATAAVPDQKQSKRAVELHTTSMTYPQILPTKHFILLSSECGERV